MKHPSWCDEDDCEEGWHMFSASYSNQGLARIEVRLCQDINTGKIELDLGDSNGSYNNYTEDDEIESEVSDLRKFSKNLIKLLDAIESK